MADVCLGHDGNECGITQKYMVDDGHVGKTCIWLYTGLPIRLDHVPLDHFQQHIEFDHGILYRSLCF